MSGWKNRPDSSAFKLLAADIAELERRTAQRRIDAAIAEAKRRTITPDAKLLPWCSVDSALERIGQGQTLWEVAIHLRCGMSALCRSLLMRAAQNPSRKG